MPEQQLLLISSSATHNTERFEHCAAEMREFFGGITKVTFVPYALFDRGAYYNKVKSLLYFPMAEYC